MIAASSITRGDFDCAGSIDPRTTKPFIIMSNWMIKKSRYHIAAPLEIGSDLLCASRFKKAEPAVEKARLSNLQSIEKPHTAILIWSEHP
jgi:hypothetical protein